METTIRSNQSITHLRVERRVTNSKTLFWENLEFNRFGIIPILLVVIGCLGGIATGFGANGEIVKLALIAFPTVIAASLVIGLAPMKAVFYASAIAIILDLIVLL